MFSLWKNLFYFFLINLNSAILQLNLHDTERTSQVQHHCLRFIQHDIYDAKINSRYYELSSYCLTEQLTEYNLENDSSLSKFSFAQLAKDNISSEQLYYWSAPIDLIERYQFYLNQLPKFNDSLLATDIFYNCTLPRFGPQCQYVPNVYDTSFSSLREMINEYFFYLYEDEVTSTCYTYLKCNHTVFSVCLDWSDICDGKIDCIDDGIDERDCWQLEINQCQENEHRCADGQCVQKSILNDLNFIPVCLDRSDQVLQEYDYRVYCFLNLRSSILCEDSTCDLVGLTRSCIEERFKSIEKSIYSKMDMSVTENCRLAFTCLLSFLDYGFISCNDFCQMDKCIEIVNTTCPAMIFYPGMPLLFNDIYLALSRNVVNSNILPIYICYTNNDYHAYFSNITKDEFNNMTCIFVDSFQPKLKYTILPNKRYEILLSILYRDLRRYHSIHSNSTICNHSTMYRCMYSAKCISIHQLSNNIYDCPHGDDENLRHKQIEKTHFKCEQMNRYIPLSYVDNRRCDCDPDLKYYCDDENTVSTYWRKTVLFPYICDGYQHLNSITYNERIETDETDCEQWECDNVYTHCDGIRHCSNGIDELNCFRNNYPCLSSTTQQPIRLSIDQINNGIIDCLGETDESTYCREDPSNLFVKDYCNELYWYEWDCFNFGYTCVENKIYNTSRPYIISGTICWNSNASWAICSFDAYDRPKEEEAFLLDQQFNARKIITDVSSNHFPEKKIFDSPNVNRCHRGLDVLVRLDDTTNSDSYACLCPPSYYGDRCQYQTQRVTVSIEFRTFSNSYRTLFAIVFSLIDDEEGIIHSYEQLTHLSATDCKTKYNFYLSYSTRPKNMSKNYAIHIDFYEKISLTYHGSIYLPIKFTFLPVHRIASIVHIPRSNTNAHVCFKDGCIHGTCTEYFNDSNNRTFCRCNSGWSGINCTIPYNCTCELYLSCLGMLAVSNRSICVCGLNKYGSRCLLTDPTCLVNDNSTCLNGGQCISHGYRLSSNEHFICICPKEFTGDRCEIASNEISLSFNETINVSEQLFIHFINLYQPSNFHGEMSDRLTTFQTIPAKQNSIVIYWTQPFHLVLVELMDKTYYLSVRQFVYKPSETIENLIHPSDRCRHIRELFNETFLTWHLRRRVKYYHSACQQEHTRNLSCFHDDVQFCLCYPFGNKRLANCFNFDHYMHYNCFGQSECENDARCIQNHPECPTNTMCICQPCFYGQLCQFRTISFGLSLDAIIGYYILPNIPLSDQPMILIFTLILTVIFVCIGFINGILSSLAFSTKNVREIGCGLYLLSSSVASILITLLLGFKFAILLLSQMAIVSNRLFLLAHCYSMDFLLRACLYMEQWLTASVAVERIIIVIKAAQFNRQQSNRIAKKILVILFLGIIGSCIHDPIHRHLIDETNNEKDNSIERTWCVVRYSSILQTYNNCIHIFHFFGPFLTNIISSIILITQQARQQAAIHKQQKYREILRERFREHKQILIAPIVLIILSIPRLIIAFASKCMESKEDAWLFLIAYFIALIPPMLTFIVFVLPSEFYTAEFHKSIQQIRKTMRQRLFK